MTDVFQDLNEPQKEAVACTEGRVRIVAGAGSGKTRVLAHRFAYLANEVGIDPSNILCMTFTNKAAQEMKNRIAKMVHRGHVNDFVCTIHGFCVKVLRQEIYRIGYPKSFAIIDEDDAKTLAKQVMEEMNIERKKNTVNKFLDGVAYYKGSTPYIERLILPGAADENADDGNPCDRFIRLQLKSYALDFDDIILFTLYILNTFAEAREYWQDKLNYIMVDEVQDCNTGDWKIINLLSAKHNNLFIVGDPDQAIYEWRGATPKTFVDFQADTDIILNENYRSTPDILNVANSIIANNTERVPKELFTHKRPSTTVLHVHAKSEDDEANWIAKQIQTLKKAGADYSDMAILYRSAYLSRYIEQALLKKKIKYAVWGGVRFFERREIKDCLAYLRLVEFNDDLSLRRIINVPSRKFGKASLQRLQDLARQDRLPLYDTLTKHRGEFRQDSIHQFLALIDQCRALKETMSISDLLDFILKSSGLGEMYRLDGDEERLENIAELQNSIRYYETANQEEEDLSLLTYLQDIALYTNADYKQDASTVKLMTIHQAKGLEFPYVFVIGLSEGIFPNHRAIRERKKAAEEEERRLMYVAVTRAEKALFLTESEGFSNATVSEKFPSRFFNEIQSEYIKVEGDIDPVLMDGTRMMVAQLDEEINDHTPGELTAGTRVKHKLFGEGTVIALENGSCKVAFGPQGDRVRYLQPRVLTVIA